MKTTQRSLLQEGFRRGFEAARRAATRSAWPIENFLRAGIEWLVIEEATGIDQQAFEAPPPAPCRVGWTTE